MVAHSKLLAENCLTVLSRERLLAYKQKQKKALALAVLLGITQTLKERKARFIS